MQPVDMLMLSLLYNINSKVDKIMATEQDLENAIAAVKADFSAFATSVAASMQALKDQIANGSPVTQAQLDAVVADVQAFDATIKGTPTS